MTIARAGLSATALLSCLLFSCDPPGKPKAEEAQADNREAILDFPTLYRSNCAGCHGDDGKYGPARILNDALYLSVLPRDTLRQTLVYGRAGTAMPAWSKSQGGPLTDRQIGVLVNGMYSNWGKGPVAADAPAYAAAAAAGDPIHGKRMFARDCFMCHGKGAAVGPVTTPSYLELVSNQMLRTSIIVGRPDLGMPDYRRLNLGKPLTDQDVTDLVSYISSQRTSPAPGETGVGGEQSGQIGQRENENGTGQGPMTSGNQGSGNGPGSPRHLSDQDKDGNRGSDSSSQGGVK